MNDFKYTGKPNKRNINEPNFWFFSRQRIRNQKHLKNQKKSKRFISYSLIGLLIVVFGSFCFYQIKDYRIEKYSVKTKAKIDFVKRNNYWVNDMDPQWVENYLIWYTFKVEGKKIKGFQQILLDDYHYYFDYEIKNLDTINIVYNFKVPAQNKILKKEVFDK